MQAASRLSFSKATTLGGITVTSDAGDYAFTTNNVGLTFTGAGLSVGSGASLTLNVNGPSIDPGGVLFEGSSTAGSSKWNVGNPAAPGAHAFLQFSEGSHADQAQITVLSGAGLSFIDSSTGDHATISNNAGGTVSFDTTKSAGSAKITGAGTVIFRGLSDAGSASIDSDGTILVQEQASGGTARIKLNDNAALDISKLDTTGTGVGSLEGSGNVFLGSKNLSVGSNKEFSGVIQDGGDGAGTGGSLTKLGSGALTLSGINTYTGATVVKGGALIVDGSIASSCG
jgi:autotransporter-associated beta strand protein